MILVVMLGSLVSSAVVVVIATVAICFFAVWLCNHFLCFELQVWWTELGIASTNTFWNMNSFIWWMYHWTLLVLGGCFTHLGQSFLYLGNTLQPFTQISDTIEFQSVRWYQIYIANETNNDLHVYVTTQGSADPDSYVLISNSK